MKESFWGMFVVGIGVVSLMFIYFFQSMTNTNEHNYNLLKETTEAAMVDAFDLAAYRKDGTVRIDREKFVENFLRRFAENAELSNTYVIEIYDINTAPPKVSLRVSSKSGDLNLSGDPYADDKKMNFDIVNNIDAILETKY